MSRRILNEKTYRGYELSDSPKTKDGFFTKTLDQIINITESMVKMHSKTIAVRIDIHNAQDFESPMTRRELTRIIENTQRNIKKAVSNKHSLDIKCVWVEERNHEDRHPHYHFQIFANGNAIRNGYRIFREVSRQVQRRTGRVGLVHFCESNGKTGLMIHRSSPDADRQTRQVIRHGSYIAKVQGKEGLAKGNRISSASRGFSVAAPYPYDEDDE